MDRAHRRRAHRPRVRDAGPAAAARRARHPGRPAGDGPARAFGTPRRHRTGAPCAPGLVAGPRRAGGRRGPPDTGAAQPLPSCLRLGSPIAARRGISFDRELLYLAAMFHDTGLPSPVPHVDFTVRSAALAREFADRHGVPADSREVVTNAIAMHHSPGVGLESGPEAYLMSAGAAVDVFGARSNEIPDAVRRRVVGEHRRHGASSRSGAAALREEREPSVSVGDGRGFVEAGVLGAKSRGAWTIRSGPRSNAASVGTNAADGRAAW